MLVSGWALASNYRVIVANSILERCALSLATNKDALNHILHNGSPAIGVPAVIAIMRAIFAFVAKNASKPLEITVDAVTAELNAHPNFLHNIYRVVNRACSVCCNNHGDKWLVLPFVSDLIDVLDVCVLVSSRVVIESLVVEVNHD